MPLALTHNKASFFKKQLTYLFLITLSVLLFTLSFPNAFFERGLAGLAYFAIFPISFLSIKLTVRQSILWGFIYGFLSYAFFNIWLFHFDPIAFFVVPLLAGIYFIFVFILFSLSVRYFPNTWFIIQFLIWVLYEYVRGIGFLGYSFGLLSYSQAFHPIFIQSASLFGAWFISALVVFPSFLISFIMYKIYTSKKENTLFYHIIFIIKKPLILLSICVYMFLFTSNIVFGIISQNKFNEFSQKNTPTLRVALLQHNTDPWEGGIQAYKKSYNNLKTLITKVMNTNPKPNLVIMPETAFVPSISYHLKYKTNKHYLNLIEKFMAVLAQYPQTEFIVGNATILGPDEKRQLDIKENEPSAFNSALFYKGAHQQDVYHKIHLVPFTESFPNKFPFRWIYTFLQSKNTHFWKAGKNYNIFSSPHGKYALSICFEDGFGSQTAHLVNKGASIIINITDDSWSRVKTNAMQHLQLSVFRAVENRRTLVRSTNAGMTAIINPNGHITNMLPAFTTDTLVEDVFLYNVKTMYTKKH